MMPQFTLTIETENAAFDGAAGPFLSHRPRHEIARILRRAADRVGSVGLGIGDASLLYDHNGNRVGTMKLTDDEDS